MKILLTGASGFIGSHIRQTLTINNDVVTPTHKEANFNTFIHSDDWLPLLKNVDVVINSVGIMTETSTQNFQTLHTDTPIALFQACEQSNVKRIIQISALGVDDNAFTPYQISKLAADDVLRNLDISWFVLRPSLIYGKGGASLAMFKRLASLALIPLPITGKQCIQPVYIDDLSAVVKQCLNRNIKDCQTLNIVGPHTMTLADYIQAIRQSLGKDKALIVPIPHQLTLLLSHLGKHLLPLMHPDNVRMLQQGNTADVSPFKQFLGRTPISMNHAFKKMRGK